MDDQEQAARFGQIYGVRYIVTGSVNRMGDFSISARLIDTQTAAIRRTARISGGDFRPLNQQLGKLARRLQDDSPPPVTPPPVTPPPRIYPPTPTPTPVPQGLNAHGQRPGERRVLSIAPGVTMAFRWCPAGEFLMGSPVNEFERDSDEGPQTRVRFTRGFWMAETEVTQLQYQTVMGTNPSNWRGNELPVEQVSHTDANNFCLQLGARTGLAVQIPTELQWEYACRAGTSTAFWFGNSYNQVSANAWFLDNAGQRSQRVGTKPANPWGIHDMHGNVWEWTSSGYANAYPGGAQVDWRGHPPSSYVNRGGSFANRAQRLRSAYRHLDSAGYRDKIVGFRVMVQP